PRHTRIPGQPELPAEPAGCPREERGLVYLLDREFDGVARRSIRSGLEPVRLCIQPYGVSLLEDQPRQRSEGGVVPTRWERAPFERLGEHRIRQRHTRPRVARHVHPVARPPRQPALFLQQLEAVDVTSGRDPELERSKGDGISELGGAPAFPGGRIIQVEQEQSSPYPRRALGR